MGEGATASTVRAATLARLGKQTHAWGTFLARPQVRGKVFERRGGKTSSSEMGKVTEWFCTW